MRQQLSVSVSVQRPDGQDRPDRQAPQRGIWQKVSEVPAAIVRAMFPRSIGTAGIIRDDSESEKESKSATQFYFPAGMAVFFLVVWVGTAYFTDEGPRASVPAAIVGWVTFFLFMPALWLFLALVASRFGDKAPEASRKVWFFLSGLIFVVLVAYSGAFYFADDNATPVMLRFIASGVVFGLVIPALVLISDVAITVVFLALAFIFALTQSWL